MKRLAYSDAAPSLVKKDRGVHKYNRRIEYVGVGMEYRQRLRCTKEDIGNGHCYLGRLGKRHREVTRISED